MRPPPPAGTQVWARETLLFQSLNRCTTSYQPWNAFDHGDWKPWFWSITRQQRTLPHENEVLGMTRNLSLFNPFSSTFCFLSKGSWYVELKTTQKMQSVKLAHFNILTHTLINVFPRNRKMRYFFWAHNLICERPNRWYWKILRLFTPQTHVYKLPTFSWSTL